MSFNHKAFSFDWTLFERELAPMLSEALLTKDPTKLLLFVDANARSCSGPDDGEPLDSQWRQLMDPNDVQQVADVALTKYYDPSADHGLSESWMDTEKNLPQSAREALLGSSFGPRADALFDPGRMGSYFQSPDQVRASLAALRRLKRPAFDDFARFLDAVVADAKGLYVTF